MTPLEKLRVEKKLLFWELNKEKRMQHKRFINEHKKTFKFLDLLVLIMVLLNFGAVATTNLLVVKKAQEAGENITLYETNPAQSKLNDYEQHPTERLEIMPFIKQALFWLLLIMCYVYFRSRVYNHTGLFILCSVIGVYTLIIGFDFFNNLGYYAAVKWCM